MSVVLKLGGELIESPQKLRAMGKVVAKAAKKHRLVVVHGGGREIDAALAHMGIAKHQVDGLRVTDEATLEVVVSVLAGTINTHFVAAINAAGGRAVGLSGADAGVAPVKKAPAHKATNGELVDLGMVGLPINAPKPALPSLLSRKRYVPVIACVSAGADGRLFNVNADTLAGNLAARLKAKRLVIAGATAGVLDANKRDDRLPQQQGDRRARGHRHRQRGDGGQVAGVPGGAQRWRQERGDCRRTSTRAAVARDFGQADRRDD